MTEQNPYLRHVHRWKNPKTESFPSLLDGLGLRAKKDLSAGEVVMVYGGIIVPASEITKYRGKLGHIGIQISDDFFIVPRSRDELKREGTVNHSCEPNVGFKSQLELIAIRDVIVGEEIMFDYAFSESNFESFNCRCGSEHCRKIVTPDDWQLEELQAAYGEYFSPYLKEKFR